MFPSEVGRAIVNEDADGRGWEGWVKAEGSAGNRVREEKYALPKRYILSFSLSSCRSKLCSPSLILKQDL